MSAIDRLHFGASLAPRAARSRGARGPVPSKGRPKKLPRKTKRVIEPEHRAVALSLAPLVARLRALALAYRLNDDGRAVGLDMAADVAEQGGPRILQDGGCPDCHGPADLRVVKPDRLIKRCTACGHQWNEEPSRPEVEFVGRGGWVRLKGNR